MKGKKAALFMQAAVRALRKRAASEVVGVLTEDKADAETAKSDDTKVEVKRARRDGDAKAEDKTEIEKDKSEGQAEDKTDTEKKDKSEDKTDTEKTDKPEDKTETDKDKSEEKNETDKDASEEKNHEFANDNDEANDDKILACMQHQKQKWRKRVCETGDCSFFAAYKVGHCCLECKRGIGHNFLFG